MNRDRTNSLQNGSRVPLGRVVGAIGVFFFIYLITGALLFVVYNTLPPLWCPAPYLRQIGGEPECASRLWNVNIAAVAFGLCISVCIAVTRAVRLRPRWMLVTGAVPAIYFTMLLRFFAVSPDFQDAVSPTAAVEDGSNDPADFVAVD